MNSVLRTLTLFALLAVSSSQRSSNFKQEDCKVIKTSNNPQYKNLDNRCFIKTQPGMCRAAFPSYHFDQATGRCVKGLHGGCDDGCLAFSTMKECEGICVKNIIQSTTQTKPQEEPQDSCKVNKPKNLSAELNKLDDKCFIKTEPGMCRAAFSSYHFDLKQNKCVKDIFGGCADGCSVFGSMQECESSCVKKSNQPATQVKPQERKMEGSCKVNKPNNLSADLKKLDDKCFIKTEPGMCRMSIESYHFDSATGKCIEDSFGGCADGCLVFESKQECESSCVKKNSQPAKKEEPKTNGSFSQESCKVEIPDVIFNPLVKFDRKCYIKTDSGMCRGAFPSYHFDPSKGKCVEDVYGGCGGCLAFTSIEECNSTCRIR